MLSTRKSIRIQCLILACTCVVLFAENIVGAGILLFGLPLFVGALWLLLEAAPSFDRRRGYMHFVTAIVLAIAIGPAIFYTSIPFRWASAALRLSFQESEYLGLIGRAEAGEAVPAFYITQEEPHRRYSFFWGDLLGDWWGIVHDKSRTFPADSEESFGGRLGMSLHLWGPWYYVSY